MNEIMQDATTQEAEIKGRLENELAEAKGKGRYKGNSCANKFCETYIHGHTNNFY